MKFVERHPFADPDAVARKVIEIANGVEAAQDGRIFIERVNEPFLAAGGSGQEFRAGVERAIALGWIWRHESGTYLKLVEGHPANIKDRPARPYATSVVGHSRPNGPAWPTS